MLKWESRNVGMGKRDFEMGVGIFKWVGGIMIFNFWGNSDLIKWEESV